MASSWSRSVTRQGSELDSEPILNSRRLLAVVLFTLMCGWNNGVKQCAKLYCTLLDVWFLIFLAIMLVSSALSAVVRFLPSFCAFPMGCTHDSFCGGSIVRCLALGSVGASARHGLQQLSNFPCWGAFILWRLWKLWELRANLVFVVPGARSEVHTSNKGGFVSRLPADLAGHCLELFVEQE